MRCPNDHLLRWLWTSVHISNIFLIIFFGEWTLTCCKELCQAAKCEWMGHEGCPHHRTPRGSRSACSRTWDREFINLSSSNIFVWIWGSFKQDKIKFQSGSITLVRYNGAPSLAMLGPGGADFVWDKTASRNSEEQHREWTASLICFSLLFGTRLPLGTARSNSEKGLNCWPAPHFDMNGLIFQCQIKSLKIKLKKE